MKMIPKYIGSDNDPVWCSVNGPIRSVILNTVSGFIEMPAWSSVGVFVHRPVCGSFKYSVVVKGE